MKAKIWNYKCWIKETDIDDLYSGIRDLLIAQVKIVIGGIRGFYSGEKENRIGLV